MDEATAPQLRNRKRVVIMDTWRELLYPLGFLSSAAFGGRVLVQWLSSEAKQKSVVPKSFWILSLIGNLLLLLHSLFQVQYHVSLIQACNAVISWRNLNLMGTESRHWKTQSVIILMATSTFTITGLYFLRGYLFNEGQTDLFLMPENFWTNGPQKTLSLFWHLFGFVGLTLFASRFWVQWWLAETAQSSSLGRSFWWLSLIGDLFCLTYFLQIKDPVNIIGPALGLIPYIRNLMLINKSEKIPEKI